MTMGYRHKGDFPWSWFLRAMFCLTVLMVGAVSTGVHYGWLQ